MKKVLALFFALVLCLPLSPAAFAAEEEEVELADYTYESAKEVIAAAGWEGISCSVAQRKFWLPAGLTRMELTEEAKEAGYLACYLSGNFMLSVAYLDYDGIRLEEYLDAVTENGVRDPRMEEVNGVDTVIYDEPQKDGTICRIAATTEPDGRFLEFVFRTNSEKLDDLIYVCIATIRSQS